MDPKQSDTSRRTVVGGLATGLVAAIGTPAFAQQAAAPATAGAAATTSPVRNPVTEYPRPDHGETRYKGSGRLAGRKALITGGDSGIGRAAAIAFAREGADVAFNYLPAEEPDAREVVELIRAEGRKAVPLPGDIRDEAFCTELVADAVRKLGGLAGSIGWTSIRG